MTEGENIKMLGAKLYPTLREKVKKSSDKDTDGQTGVAERRGGGSCANDAEAGGAAQKGGASG